ncbi:MAG: LysM peptidoglycan-binding domain-containing protein [Clostridia bacterium]|nr:LysM peptidoglycan-binding domain-containing protein [Clostridia bacterium]
MYIYVVSPGDTLASISTRIGLPQSVIAAANGLREPYSLTPGQALLILNGARTYTVRPGDSIYSIAAQNGLSTNELWRLNPSLAGGNIIYPGQTLVVYLPPTDNVPLVSTGYAYPFINRSILRSTLPYLDFLAIFSYGFRADGSLVIADDAELISIANEYGVKPMLVLTSLGDDGRFSSEAVSSMLTSPEVQQNLINNIVETAQLKGYASVNSDLEYIPP